MNTIRYLTGRNIRVFLRDRTSVFFSFLSMIIIIGLYAVFLAQMNVNSIESLVGKGTEGIRFLVDSWIMAGIVVVNTVTVTLGVFGIMIDDEAKKRIAGFLVAPIDRGKLIAGYLLTSWIVGMLLCILSLFFAEVYIVASGGQPLQFLSFLKAIGLIAVSVFSSSSIVFFLVSFVRTASGFSTLSTLIGTVIGFVTGIYLPIGVLPDAVQTFVKFVPATHMAALMREVFLSQPMDIVFNGAPNGAVSTYQETFGVIIKAGSTTLSAWMMIGYALATGVVFLALSVFRAKRRKLS